MSERAMIVLIFHWNLGQLQLTHQVTIISCHSIQPQVLLQVRQQEGTKHLFLCQQEHYLQVALGSLVGSTIILCLCIAAAQVLLLPQLSMVLQTVRCLPMLAFLLLELFMAQVLLLPQLSMDLQTVRYLLMVALLLLELFMVAPFLATAIHPPQFPLAQEQFPMMQSFRAIQLLPLHP